MSLTKRASAPATDIRNNRIDELWGIHTKLDDLQDKMARLSQTDLDLEHTDSDENVSFPATNIVLKFAAGANRRAVVFLVNKIQGKRRNGGAELLVRKQPSVQDQPEVLHVSASKIKFLEVAEELEVRKRDCQGLVREFTVNEMDMFVYEGMHLDDLLTTAEKERIVLHELENIRALPEDEHLPGYPHLKLYQGQSIVQLCLREQILERMFPLHDTEALNKLGKKWYWALFRQQPFEDIRVYFGESIALYFSFLGFYTTALIAPMVLGILQMFLTSETLVFSSIFNVLWVTIFLEVWKRKQSELAFAWGTRGITSLDEPRANFHGAMGVDAITGRIQPQYPRWKTNVKMYCVSLPIVLLCLLVGFWVMLVTFWAEESLMDSKQRYGSKVASLFIMLPSILYCAGIYIMRKYYRRLATFLTEWENHRTQSQFDRHRVTKLVLFEFVNNFMALFYIAFYIQDMDMLRNQLAIMLIILQAINNFQEAILPLIIQYYIKRVMEVVNRQSIMQVLFSKKRTSSMGFVLENTASNLELKAVTELDPEDPRIEQANKEGSLEPYEGTYDDYLEMFIQFGYVFLFSSVYPMAAFWAVFNNVLEIRADAFKLCRVYQRPLPKRVKDIGAWQRAFEAIGAIAVLTNCGLLCMSPKLRNLAPNQTSVEWVLLFVAIEHILLAAKYALHEMIPDNPEWVRAAVAKIDYLSKQALKNERMVKSRRQLTRRFKTVHGPHGQSSDS